MNTLKTARRIFQQFQIFVTADYSTFIALFSIFAMPLVIWPILSSILLSSNLAANKFINAVLSVIVGLCHPFGALSISLCTYAWQKEEKEKIGQFLKSLNSFFGRVISTYLAQAILLIIPMLILFAIVFVLKILEPVRDIYYPLIIYTIYWFFYYFAWPLLIIKRISGFRNAIESVKLSSRYAFAVIILLAPFLCWALLFQILASNSDSIARGILSAIGYIAFLPLSAVQMITYQNYSSLDETKLKEN